MSTLRRAASRRASWKTLERYVGFRFCLPSCSFFLFVAIVVTVVMRHCRRRYWNASIVTILSMHAVCCANNRILNHVENKRNRDRGSHHLLYCLLPGQCVSVGRRRRSGHGMVERRSGKRERAAQCETDRRVARWVLGLFKLNPCLQIEFVTPGQAPHPYDWSQVLTLHVPCLAQLDTAQYSTSTAQHSLHQVVDESPFLYSFILMSMSHQCHLYGLGTKEDA